MKSQNRLSTSGVKPTTRTRQTSKYAVAMGQPWFHVAWGQKLANQEVAKVIQKWRHRYASRVDWCRLEDAIDKALTRAIVDTREALGRTFITSFRQFLAWETNRAMKGSQKDTLVLVSPDQMNEREAPSDTDYRSHEDLCEIVERFLPLPVRRVVLGHYVEGKTFEELAVEEKCCRDSIVKRIRDGLRKLQNVPLIQNLETSCIVA